MIVDNALYRNGVRVPVSCDTGDLKGVRSAATGENDFVWVGLHEPDERELERVQDVYGLHPLALEDAFRAHQRPKLERYDDTLFLVLKTLWYVDEFDAVETGEINVFVGQDFVISVRHGEGNALHQARLQLEGMETVLQHGPSAVVYALCDQVVDRYEEVAADLQEDVDEVEGSVFSEERTNDAKRIYLLKRELAEMRRALLPLRDPMMRFAGKSVPGIAPESSTYFRDVADHLARVTETIDALDNLLSTAFDAYIAQISVQQNDDMRRISALLGLLVAPTLVGSVYGMNFDNMPELHWAGGYVYALLLMLASSLLVWIVSRRSGWL